MKITFVSLAVLVVSLSGSRADTIAQWNFNSPVPDGNVNTGTTTPSAGSGAVVLIGGTTASFVTGDTKDDPAKSVDNSGWSTKSYPASGTSNKLAGVRFDLDTTGYNNISVSWYQQNSSTASRYERFQYSLDGTSFIDADVIEINLESVFTNKVVDLSSIPGAANNPLFAFQIVSEYESTAMGWGTDDYVATKTGSTYGTSGTMRYDMVTVSGSLIPGANTAPSISSVSNQTVRVNQTSAPARLTVGDAEDTPGSLRLSAASSDTTLIPVANIIFAGADADRTVSVRAGGQTGICTLTITVTDTGGRFSSTSFLVTVLPLNTPPFVSAIPGTNTLIGVPAAPLDFTVGDLETAAGSLTLSAISANPTLVPNTTANISFGGSGSNRTVTVTPAPGQIGVAPITVRVSDGVNSTSTAFPLLVTPSPNVILYEPFTYTNGSLVTNSAGLWDNRSGTWGECLVTNNQLWLAATQTEDVVASLVGSPYSVSNQTVLYASFKVKFLALPKALPGYFAHFGSGSTLRGRVFAGTTNVPAGFFHLYASNGDASPSAEVGADLILATTYFVVTRYDIDSASTALWVNPTSESDACVIASDPQTPRTISSYAFRQDTTVGAVMVVDDLKVGLSFNAVMPSASIYPIPLKLQYTDGKVILSWTDPAFGLQAAPNVTGVYTNIPGATSPYTNAVTSQQRFFRLKSN